MFHNEKELFSKKGKIILQKANEYKIKKSFFKILVYLYIQ